MVRILSDADVDALLDLGDLLDVVETAFRKQAAGAVERPPRPHFPVGTGLDADAPEDPLGTGLTMPAYLHGDDTYATKLASVHEGNADRGLPTVNAQIAVTDAATGQPVAYMAGTRVTNARTGCIGGNAVRHLTEGPVSLAVFGAGTQARWQTRAIAAATDIDSVAVYSPSDSREACAADLGDELDASVRAADSPADALSGASVVVTATTSTEPVLDAADLADGTLVVAVGAYTSEMCELDAETVARAGRIYADVPEEAVETGDLQNRVSADDCRPLAAAFDDQPVGADEVVVVESVGSAVLDAATAGWLVERAAENGVGEAVSL
ncbi:ornithine cyclodeaminase family protein [Haloarchaeobius amylolyticus]|uniref:ornithine cyclodeaminase family protein n=1 Tax=Haloarchaeobius amylolyticus TaxID=1198296 RepID=UPI00226DF832|nr:ornithine cyclodeaminase family protein [Haloarchaeobius amylolyticus]